MKCIRIPSEILTRFDDVSFECPDRWDKCTNEQKQRVVEECRHVIDLIKDGGSWYEPGLQTSNIRRSCEATLRKIAEAEHTFIYV